MTLVETGERNRDRRPPQAGEASPARREDVLYDVWGRGIGRRILLSRFVSTTAMARRPLSPPCSRWLVSVCSTRMTTKCGHFRKSRRDGGWINGGFFVLSTRAGCIPDDPAIMWEREPLEELAREQQLQAYYHHDFWQPMDTLRDKQQLEELWTPGRLHGKHGESVLPANEYL